MDNYTKIMFSIILLLMLLTIFVETKNQLDVVDHMENNIKQTGVIIGPDGRIGTTTTLSIEELHVQAMKGCVAYHQK